jgi:signal transduction histidine kinase
MTNFFKTFYGKLSIAFLVLLLLMGVVQIFFSVNSSIEFVKEADQRVNKTLAHDIGVEMEPLLGDTMDMPGIQHLMHYLMVMNPHIEIYLLDRQGKILAFFAEPAKKVKIESVDLAPVKEFIANNGDKWIVGDDPRYVGRKKAFSVAPIKLSENRDGYIYVILGGEQFDYASASLWDNFMISTAAKALLVSVIFTAIIGLVLFFFMTKRLRRMNDVVRRFESGDFSERLPVGSGDEFGQLASAFNQMADTIVANIDELKRTDVLRRELVANVSHDLRSPLASLQGYLETILMKYDTMPKDQKRSYLEVSLKNIENLNKLVQELFELSRLDALQVQPQLEPLAVSDLVQDVVMKLQPDAIQRHIHLQAIHADHLPMVDADVGMIERVLSNLIENAIRHTPADGEIRVIPSRANSGVRVEVSDSGCGIPPEDLPHIFNRFYQGRRSSDGQKHGTGLGLAIAKKMLELHGSDIRVNTKVNEGTTFYFDLHASSLSTRSSFQHPQGVS